MDVFFRITIFKNIPYIAMVCYKIPITHDLPVKRRMPDKPEGGGTEERMPDKKVL